MSLCHQIYFSQHQTAFNILILKSPVGVKELFFLFLCDLQAELDVKLPGEDGGRDRVNSRLAFAVIYVIYRT